MKVFIRKTREGSESQTPPIKGATKVNATRYVYRNKDIKNHQVMWAEFTKLYADIEQMPDGNWRGKYREPSKVWTADIDDIFALAETVNCGVIVFPPGEFVEKYPVVEIYDDYRE